MEEAFPTMSKFTFSQPLKQVLCAPVPFSVETSLSPSIIRPTQAIILQYGRTDNATLQVVHALSFYGVATEGDLKYIKDGSLDQLFTTLREPLAQGEGGRR